LWLASVQTAIHRACRPDAFAGLLPASAMGAGFHPREKTHHLAIERRQIRRLAAGHQVVVHYNFFIDPVPARISYIILYRVITGEAPSLHHTCRDQFPRRMADRRNGLARTLEMANELLKLRLNSDSVGVQRSAGQH